MTSLYKEHPDTQLGRTSYIIKLYQELNPSMDIDTETLIKGTSIGKLCEFAGPPYHRIKDWCEKKLGLTEKGSGLTRDVKFSGIKDVYEGGATRDTREGKGRYDLISPLFLRRLALVLERGAKNHGDNNWMGGIKYSRLIDSSLRHITQYNGGLRDEDHIIQAVCNLMFLVHFEEQGRVELDDLTKK